MPRLRQVPRSEAPPIVLKYYKEIFGERCPVAEPGTATGTPGDYWTIIALAPHVFEQLVNHMESFSVAPDDETDRPSKLDGKLREIALLRTVFVVGSQFCWSQHCKAGRDFGLSQEQIDAIPSWQTSPFFSDEERTVLAWTDALVLERGRASDDLFATLQSYLSDELILDLSHHVMMYNLHAVLLKAFRSEYDDVPERVVEIAAPEGDNTSWRAGG